MKKGKKKIEKKKKKKEKGEKKGGGGRKENAVSERIVVQVSYYSEVVSEYAKKWYCHLNQIF